MKKVILFFLAIVVVLQCSMKFAIVAYYQLNKEYIASTLCENKDKPDLKCNGKCYLTKKIKTQDEKETKFPSLLKDTEGFVIFISSIDITLHTIVYKIQNVFNSRYLIKPYQSPICAIFQPPQ